jgi:hypothetical protein
MFTFSQQEYKLHPRRRNEVALHSIEFLSEISSHVVAQPLSKSAEAARVHRVIELTGELSEQPRNLFPFIFDRHVELLR